MKKHVRTILTVLLSICILLSCISVGFAAAPANENQQASREAFRVGIDSETKGHWQGKYGASGTDTEDDTSAVNAAIAAARASEKKGGIIYFPNGNYYVGDLKLPANIVIRGESTEKTVLYYNGNTLSKNANYKERN